MTLREGYLVTPQPGRFSPASPGYDRALAAHAAAVGAGHDTYLDPRTGFTVLTAAFLAERGTCCDAGCRHCPYVGADT